MCSPEGVWGGPPEIWPRPEAERRRKPAEDGSNLAPALPGGTGGPKMIRKESKRATCRRLSGPDGPGSPQDGLGCLQEAPQESPKSQN